MRVRPNANVGTPQPLGILLVNFQWQQAFAGCLEKKEILLEQIIPQVLQLAELSAANHLDTSSPEGKQFEQQVPLRYLNHGEVLRACLPPSKPFRGSLTFFIPSRCK